MLSQGLPNETFILLKAAVLKNHVKVARRCHLILYETQQYDVKSEDNYSSFKVNTKGNNFKYFRNLRNTVFIKYYEMLR